MASSRSHAVRVLEQCRVSPPTGSVPETSLQLTFLDVLFLHASPVERLFFYHFPHSTNHFIDSVVPTLKSSLSNTLHHFYPLAGQLGYCPGSDDKLEIHYVDDDSVSLTLAECDGDFCELSGSQARAFSKLEHLIPSVAWSDGSTPLLALQVTVFPNQGVSVGVTIRHVACDGSGFLHFVRSWAAACKSAGSVALAKSDSLPLHDRTVIVDPSGLRSASVKGFHGSKFNGRTAQDGTVLASFSLGRQHVQMLKQWVSAEAYGGNTPLHCSTFVVACAHVWASLVKARGLTDGNSTLTFAVDCRGRLQTPIPPAYFGNCVTVCFVDINVGHISGANGVLFAAKAIGEAIERLEEGVLEGTKGNAAELRPVVLERSMMIVGSPRLRVYDTDFGWGWPVKVELTSVCKVPGAVALAESREEQGGIEIGLGLPKARMDEFTSHFFGGLMILGVDM